MNRSIDGRRCVRFLAATCLAVGVGWAQAAPPREAPVFTFGTTVVSSSGLVGEIYFIHHGARKLPHFKKLKPVGRIYTTVLNVPPRDFAEGFPGVTNRFEWFAIDYSGKFWIENPGEYRFALTSDDGSRLYIDGREVIDNDGAHPASTRKGSVTLPGGVHHMRVSYFQGPRYAVALVLKVAVGDDPLRVFDTNDFKPPVSPGDWRFGTPVH